MGRFCGATIVDKNGSNLKVHYNRWGRKWDVWSDYSNLDQLRRFAKYESISKRPRHRLKHLAIGDNVDINTSKLNLYDNYNDKIGDGWTVGKIINVDANSGQVHVAIAFPNNDCKKPRKIRWVHLDEISKVAQQGCGKRLEKELKNRLILQRDDEMSIAIAGHVLPKVTPKKSERGFERHFGIDNNHSGKRSREKKRKDEGMSETAHKINTVESCSVTIQQKQLQAQLQFTPDPDKKNDHDMGNNCNDKKEKEKEKQKEKEKEKEREKDREKEKRVQIDDESKEKNLILEKEINEKVECLWHIKTSLETKKMTLKPQKKRAMIEWYFVTSNDKKHKITLQHTQDNKEKTKRIISVDDNVKMQCKTKQSIFTFQVENDLVVISVQNNSNIDGEHQNNVVVGQYKYNFEIDGMSYQQAIQDWKKRQLKHVKS